MKILEALQGLNPEQKVKIGAADGTRHWYVGTAGDVRKDLDSLNERCQKYACNLQKNAVQSLDYKIRNPLTPGVFVREQLKKACDLGEYFDLSWESYRAALEKYFADVKKAKTYMDQCSKRLEEYAALKDREVVRREMCIPCAAGDPGTLQLIIDGFEDGAFWTTDEADKLPAVKFLRFGENGDEEM